MSMLIGRLLALWAIWKRVLGREARHAPVERPDPLELDPREREVMENAAAERLVALLLFAVGGFCAAFVVLYVVYPNTPLLGATGGLALACLAAALMIASLRVVPQVTEVEERVPLDKQQAQEVADEIRAGTEGVSRRGMLVAAGGVCACGLGAAMIAPAASLGPRIGDSLASSPWRAGRRLVDDSDQPIAAGDLEIGAFITAFPEGADKRDLGSPLVVVRLGRSDIHLRPERRTWAPDGILAYSKICTHAGCAISEFRWPLDESTTQQRPALVCPCHYSTFDAGHEAQVLFGPAGRPLPQLPLRVDAEGNLRAAGGLSDDPGPAWFGVRKRT